MNYTRHSYDEKYPRILEELQAKQNDLLWQLNKNGGADQGDIRELVLPFVKKHLADNNLQMTGYSAEELASKLFNDLQRYSILTDPLNDPFVEGININAWNDLRVRFINGSSQKIDGFSSPQQAIDIIKRLFQQSHQTIDDAIPMAEGSINNNIRITALQTPIVDNDIGVCCYIRKLSKRVFTEKEYLTGDFAVKKELDFLKIALRRGVSTLLVGKVNTGKTTLMSYLLSTLPDESQVITIEQGAREISLVKTDAAGNAVNNVVHLLTRESADEAQNITQEKLVEKGLRLNPDNLSVAEMRNVEAYAAQEASLSGNTVISTAHAGSARQAHKRVASLCRKKYPTDFKTALENACEAFPLVVFIHTLEDNRRRIMNVSECSVEDDKINYRTIWEYQIEENTSDQFGAKIRGRHVQVNNISKQLLGRMKLYGISKKEIEEINKSDILSE